MQKNICYDKKILLKQPIVLYLISIEHLSGIYRASIGKTRLMSGGREMETGPETWNRLSKDKWSTTRKTTPFSDAVFSYPQPTRPLRTR